MTDRRIRRCQCGHPVCTKWEVVDLAAEAKFESEDVALLVADAIEAGRYHVDSVIYPANVTELLALPQAPKPYEMIGWGILNPYGGLWGPTVYDKPDEAHDRLRAYWGKREQVEKFSVVAARSVTEVVNVTARAITFSTIKHSGLTPHKG